MIYKYYKDGSGHAISNFQKGVICFSHAAVFEDKKEANAAFAEEISLKGTPLETDETKTIAEQIAKVRFRYRIFCACQNLDEEYLWEKYAENEKGFCLEYDENDFRRISDQIIIKSIVYSDHIPEIAYNQAQEEIVRNQLFHKRMKYMCEKEIRIIYPLPNSCIKVVTSNMEFEDCALETPCKESNEVTFCPSIPINHLSRDNTELPVFAKYTAPLNIELPIQSKGIIIGRNCPKDKKEYLTRIANIQGIRILKRGETKNG